MKAVSRDYYGKSALTLNDFSYYGRCINPDKPYDPSDFRRCYNWKVLNNLNGAENRGAWVILMKEISNAYPVWKATAYFWDEFEKLYLEETKNETEFGNAPKLYEAMQTAEQRYKEIQVRDAI